VIRTRAEPVWEAYVGDGLRLPDDADRARIEGAVGARLPDDYRELVVAHQGQVLVADPVAVPEQGKVDFRQSQDRPAVVFIDHEIEGDEGVTPVAPDFAGFRARWIDAAA